MAAAAPYIMMAVGTAAQMQAQQQQADDKRNILNQQLTRDADASNKASAAVLNEGQNYSPLVRQQAITDQGNATYDKSMADLNAAAPSGNAGAVTTTGDAGNVSDDFVKAKADRAVTEGTRLTGIAREIAKTRAPNLQLVTEGQRGADLAGNLQSLYGSNSNMGRATANDANSVLEPQYGGLGKIATLIGGAMAGGQIAKQAASTKAGGGINFAPQGDVYR